MSVYAGFAVPPAAIAPGALLASYPAVTVELERVVPAGEDGVSHFLWIAGDEYAVVVDALRDDASVPSLELLDELADSGLVRIEWEQAAQPLFAVVQPSDGRLVSARGSSDGWIVTLEFPVRATLAAFYEACRARGLEAKLREVSESRFANTDHAYGLSERQYETIVAAFEAGFFEVPRATTIGDLAEQLGVSNQAVSERLRRGLRRFLERTLGESPIGDSANPDVDG